MTQSLKCIYILREGRTTDVMKYQYDVRETQRQAAESISTRKWKKWKMKK